jgi:2-oxoglutarate ferredoxin oxidoreductase subunit beta
VARWTTYHFDQLTASMAETIKKRGFSFIEILSPCPTYYFKYNRLKNDESISNYYRNHTRIENGADTKKCAFDDTRHIILGKLVDTQRPTLSDRLKTQGVDHD